MERVRGKMRRLLPHNCQSQPLSQLDHPVRERNVNQAVKLSKNNVLKLTQLLSCLLLKLEELNR